MSSAASYIDTGSVKDRDRRNSYDRVPGAWPLAEIPEEQPVETPPTCRFSASSANTVRHVSYNLDDPTWDARSNSRSYIDPGKSSWQPVKRGAEFRDRKKRTGNASNVELGYHVEQEWDIEGGCQSYIDPGDSHPDQTGASSVSEGRTRPSSPPRRGRPFGIDGGWDTRSSLCSYIDPGIDRSSATKVEQWLQSGAAQNPNRLPVALASTPHGIAVQRLSRRKAVIETAPITAPNGPNVHQSKFEKAPGRSELVDRRTSHPHGEPLRFASVASAASPPRFIIHSKDGDTAIIDADVDYVFPPRQSNSLATSPVTAVPVNQQKKPRAVSVTLPHIDPRLELLPQPMAVADTWILQSADDKMSSHQPLKRSKATPDKHEASSSTPAPHPASFPPPDLRVSQGQQVEEIRNPTVAASPLSSISSAQASPNDSTFLAGSISNFFEYGPLTALETLVPMESMTIQDVSDQPLSETSARNSGKSSVQDSTKTFRKSSAKESATPSVHKTSEETDLKVKSSDQLSEAKKDEPVISSTSPPPAEADQMIPPAVATNPSLKDSGGFPMPSQSVCIPAYTYDAPQDYAQAHPQYLPAFHPSTPSAPMAYSNYQPPAVESVSSSPGKGQPAAPATGAIVMFSTPQPATSSVLHQSRPQSVDDGYCNEIWNGIPVRVGTVRMTRYPSRPAQRGEVWD